MNATETPAQKARNQHIAKVKSEIVRLQNAVTAFEQYTGNLPDWSYVGDWEALSNDVGNAAEQADKLADSTYSREK